MKLPEFETPEQFVELMKFVERATMPIELHGWEGSVYILWRRGQEWYLSKVDPSEDHVAGWVRLPTVANHLMVVPGDRYWALIEKRTVEGFGLQTIDSLRFIPSALVASFPAGHELCQ